MRQFPRPCLMREKPNFLQERSDMALVKVVAKMRLNQAL
jgi:hypothetical protein